MTDSTETVQIQKKAIAVSPDVHLALRRISSLDGKSLSTVVADMLRDRLAGYPEAKRAVIVEGLAL